VEGINSSAEWLYALRVTADWIYLGHLARWRSRGLGALVEHASRYRACPRGKAKRDYAQKFSHVLLSPSYNVLR
jgi:hypothetical protein